MQVELFVHIVFQINVLRNKYTNLKEVFFMNKIDKPVIIAFLTSSAIVIIVNKFKTLSEDINDFFLSFSFFKDPYRLLKRLKKL